MRKFSTIILRTNFLPCRVVNERTLQSIKLGHHCVCLSIGSSKIFVSFYVIFWVTAIVWCCVDKGIYRQYFLSEYAFFIKHWSIHTWKINYILDSGEICGEQNEPSFNFVHPCIHEIWLIVETPVDFIPWYKLAYLLGQLSSAVSLWWPNLKGCSPFICLYE